jgi:hypothetical protein
MPARATKDVLYCCKVNVFTDGEQKGHFVDEEHVAGEYNASVCFKYLQRRLDVVNDHRVRRCPDCLPFQRCETFSVDFVGSDDVVQRDWAIGNHFVLDHFHVVCVRWVANHNRHLSGELGAFHLSLAVSDLVLLHCLDE